MTSGRVARTIPAVAPRRKAECAGEPHPNAWSTVLPPDPTEQDLLAACNRGDPRAMEDLYTAHRDWVYAVALRFCRHAEDALDVTQEVFHYFFGRFPGFEIRCRIRTYLYTVARSRAIDLIRKRKPGVSLDNARGEPVAGEPDDETAGRLRVAEIVAALPEAQRDVVILRFVDGLKLSEIAERLGVPAGTVKSRLHNGLRELRRMGGFP
jgi:RNA polymerase sigma-70 factor (ECF subfamily)